MRRFLLSLLVLLWAASAPMVWGQIVYSEPGPHECELRCAVEFMPHMEGESYASAAGRQLTVFRPAAAGMATSLSLEWLELAPEAQFQVYLGAWDGAASATPIYDVATGSKEWVYLVGELDKDNGALTVVFDPQGAQHKPVKGRTGWSARVDRVSMDPATVGAPIPSRWMEQPHEGQVLRQGMNNQELFRFTSLLSGPGEGAIQELSFQLGGENYALAKLHLYELPTPAETDQTKWTLLAEAAPAGTKVTLSTTEKLKAGWHHFVVTADMGAIPLGVANVEIGPLAFTIHDDNAPAGRSLPGYMLPGTLGVPVDHAVVQGKGSVQVAVGEAQPFRPDRDAKGAYVSDSEDRSILFTPRSGEVVQLDFTAFDLALDAELRIYRGEHPVPADLLFEAVISWSNSAEKVFKQLEGHPLRGQLTQGDGKLLVVFNPKNSSSSGYSGPRCGWDATVSSVQPVAWQITKVCTSSVNSAPSMLYAGFENQVTHSIELATEGQEQQKKLAALRLKLTNAQSIKALYVYSKAKKGLGTNPWQLDERDKLATVATPSGEAEVAFSLPVEVSGSTTLYVAVDLKATAEAVSGPYHVAVQDYKLEGATDWVPAQDPAISTPPSWRVVPIYLMEQGTHSLTVDGSILLYDDGGPNGNPTAGFEGTCTLTPKSSAKRIQVVLSDVHLVDAAIDPAENDKLMVYNGTQAVAEQELWHYQKGNYRPVTVVSNVADGSLTLYFKTPKGTSSGFKCEVTEAEPQAMAVTAVKEASSIPDPNPRAALEGVLTLLSIETTGAENPLKLTKLSFSIPEAVTLISSARVYLYDKNGEKKLGLLGEQKGITGDQIEIPLTPTKPLLSGENYLLIEVTGQPNLQEGTLLLPQDIQVTCSDGKAYPDGGYTPANGRKVQNLYQLENDHPLTLPIGAQWELTHKPYSKYVSKYDLDTKGGTVVLTPRTPGNVVELEFFGKFGFNAVSGSTFSEFRVYSGDKAEGTPLLEVKNKVSALPTPAKYRPNAGGQALTVVFQANGNKGEGFHAHVQELRLAPMELKAIEVTQASTAAIAAVGKPEEVLMVKLTSVNDQSPLSVSNLGLKLTDHIQKVHIYATPDATFATTKLVYEADVTINEFALSLPTPYQLDAGDNYLWVAVTLAADAATGTVVDASITSIKVGAQEQQLAEKGNPAGERIVKLAYLFKGDDQVNATTAFPFYDDGGIDGNATNNHRGAVTFTPQPGQQLRLIIHKAKLPMNGRNSRFFIYEGAGTTGKKLFEYRMEVKDDVVVTSDVLGGPITVQYDAPTSSTSMKYFGWEIDVQPFTPAAAAVESVKCQLAYPAPEPIRVGQEMVKAFRMDVKTMGTQGTISIAEVKLALGQGTKTEDIARIQCWTTGRKLPFTFPVLLGEVKPSDGLTISCVPVALELAVDSYVWITYDVASSAASGTKLTLRCESVKASDGAELALTTDNESTLEVSDKGMKGVYTIGGASPDFATLEKAIDALKSRGVVGAVTLNMRPGDYEERVEIPAIAGSSVVNTITLQSESGKREDVTIHSNSEHTQEPLEGYGGVLTLRGVSHFTMKNLTILSTNSKMSSAVAVCDGSHHVTFAGCKIQMPSIYKTNTKETPHLIYLFSRSDNQQPADNITVESCELVGGAFGLYAGASTYVANRCSLGLKVRNNHFDNQVSKAIFLAEGQDFEVSGNKIGVSQIEPMYEFKAIDVNRVVGPGSIASNIINLQNGAYSGQFAFFGIAFREQRGVAKGTATGRILVVNNVIYMHHYKSKGGSAGLILGANSAEDQAYITMAHNTVVLGPSISGSASGIQLYSKGTALELTNNLVQNLSSGSALWCQSASLSGITLRDNAFWATNPAALAIVDGTGKSIRELQALPAFASTIAKQATFQNVESDWRLLVNIPSTAPVDGVGTDLEGTARAALPTIGAYEYQKVTFEVKKGYPMLRRVGEEFVEVSLAATLPYTLHALPLLASETLDIDNLRKAPIYTVPSGKPYQFQVHGLTPSTSYKLHLLLIAPTGEELTSELDFQTPAPGTPLLMMVAGYPKAEPIYSDAAMLLLESSENCKLSYRLLKKGETMDGGAEPTVIVLTKKTVHSLLLRDLKPAVDYVLHYSLHAEGTEPLIWDEYSFATLAELPYEPMHYELPTWGIPGAYKLGSQTIVSSELKEAAAPAFDMVAGQSKSLGWHMEGNSATVTLKSNSYESAITGLALAATGEVKLMLVHRDVAQNETLTLSNTEGKPAWFSLKDKKLVELVALRLEKEAGVEVTLLEVGTPKPLPRVQVPAFVTIPADATQPVKVGAEYIYGAAYPLTYAWYFDGTKVADGVYLETTTLRTPGKLECRVKDAEGTLYTMPVTLVSEASTLQIASFEDVQQLSPESFWKGSYKDGVENYASGSFNFSLYSEPTYHSWHGFAYSNQTSTEWAGDYSTQDTRSAAGHGACGTPTYGVLYFSTIGGAQPEQRSVISVTSTLEGIEVPGLYVTNTAWGVHTVKKGPGIGKNKPFGQGDYAKVTITADNGKSVEKYLADYRATEEEQRYALGEWAWVDLSSLGKVKSLAFKVEGYQTNGDGQYFPHYVAVDEIGAARPEKSASYNVVTGDTECDLLPYTTLAQEKAQLTTVTPEMQPLTSAVAGVSLALDGTKLSVRGWKPENPAQSETFTFKLEQLGRTEWVKLTLNYKQSVTCKLVAVTYNDQQGEVQVTMQGQPVAVGTSLNTNDELTITATPKSGFVVDQIQVTHAARKGSSDVWVVDGTGDVSVEVTFKVKPVATFAVIELAVVPSSSGAISLLRADKTPMAVGDVAQEGDIVTLAIAPSPDYILLEEKTVLEGLDKQPDGTYRVTGNIKVRAAFRGPLRYKLVKVGFEPAKGGEIVVTFEGKSLNVGDKLCAGDKLAITATHEGKPLPIDSLKVEGAVFLDNDNLWAVRGDVSVQAFYRQKIEKKETPVEATLLGSLGLYPNPTVDKLWVSNATIPMDYVVYTVTGQAVATGHLSTDIPSLDVSTLPAGVYILQLRAVDGASQVLRFMKQ